MTQINPNPPAGKILTREIYLQVLSAALAVRNHRFVREAALAWLANFPGDLKIGWYYAQSLVGEGRASQALPILKGLYTADPEFIEAAESLLKAVELVDDNPQGANSQLSYQDLVAYLYALTGPSPRQGTVASWGKDLWLARQALSKGRFNLAEESIRRALIADPSLPLAAVIHLQFLAANPATRQENKLALARRYRQQWPDCLVCGLLLADWLMDTEDSHQAVALLHQAVARDVASQVANRLWGYEHPYKHLWPDKMEMALDIPIPADVTALLGWNRLPDISSALQGLDSDLAGDQFQDAVAVSASILENDLPSDAIQAGEEYGVESFNPQDSTRLISEEELESWLKHAMVSPKSSLPDAAGDISGQPEILEEDSHLPEPAAGGAESNSTQEIETLQSVQEEIERLAERLHLHGLTQLDGRFPVYVILSVCSRLESVYGASIAAILQEEMKRLAQVISSQRSWGSRLFFPDDPSNLKELGIKPPRPGDAWELKLALADLDAELEKRGEMIGAVLIVGGPEIVPYHRLPNPLDDPDVDVPSDNPYATRDENYFIPEWPVGRLPGGGDGDARLLIGALRRITAHHAERLKVVPWYRRLFTWFNRWVKPARHSQRLSFGYSAAIWQHAASSVFRTIGEPEDMYISPPAGLAGDCLEDYLDDLDFTGNSDESIPTPIGTLGYFNLHGVVDAPEWFGHRDPLSPVEGPEYPVALRPQDLHPYPLGKKGGFPKLVFSEACYGAHIEGKTTDNALALKFLDAGTLALVGSTCMSYGSIMGNLSAADLLAQGFWGHIQEGLPAGEALRQAKIDLINQMDQSQGFLDGQDQKTLISFNLYGDPLAQPLENANRRKGVFRSTKPTDHFEIVCDRIQNPATQPAIPEDVLNQVRQIVAQYLPGMSGARVAYTREQPECTGLTHKCPTSQLIHSKNVNHGKLPQGKNTSPARKHNQIPAPRNLVTLSKQIHNAQGTHPYYAHLTIEAGKLVKLVVSR